MKRRGTFLEYFESKLIAYIYILPLLLILVLLIAYPFFNGIYLSFTNKMIAASEEFVGLETFKRVFADPLYSVALKNSILITIGCVTIKLVFGMTISLALQHEFFGRGIVRSIILLPWAVPSMVAALAWKWMFADTNGVINFIIRWLGFSEIGVHWLTDAAIAKYSVIIAMWWQGMPFFIMMFLAGLTSISTDLYEAATVDGAGRIQKFWHITLPGLKNVIYIVVMMSTIWTFNDFNMIYNLTAGGPANRTQILPTLAYRFAIQRNNISMGAATMVSFIPVFVVLIFFLTKKMLPRGKGE